MPDAEGKGDAREERLQSTGFGTQQMLRHRDRNFVIKQMNAEALERCADMRTAYVKCATGAPRPICVPRCALDTHAELLAGRTITLAWACKDAFRELNECLHK